MKRWSHAHSHSDFWVAGRLVSYVIQSDGRWLSPFINGDFDTRESAMEAVEELWGERMKDMAG